MQAGSGNFYRTIQQHIEQGAYDTALRAIDRKIKEFNTTTNHFATSHDLIDLALNISLDTRDTEAFHHFHTQFLDYQFSIHLDNARRLILTNTYVDGDVLDDILHIASVKFPAAKYKQFRQYMFLQLQQRMQQQPHQSIIFKTLKFAPLHSHYLRTIVIDLANPLLTRYQDQLSQQQLYLDCVDLIHLLRFLPAELDLDFRGLSVLDQETGLTPEMNIYVIVGSMQQLLISYHEIISTWTANQFRGGKNPSISQDQISYLLRQIEDLRIWSNR